MKTTGRANMSMNPQTRDARSIISATLTNRLVAKMHSTKTMYYRLDEQGNMLYASRACKSICGYSHIKVTSIPNLFRSLINNPDLYRVHQTLSGRDIKDIHYNLSYNIYTSAGTLKQVSDRGIALFNKEGVLKGYSGIITEVIENKEDKAPENYYFSLLENLNDGVVNINEHFVITYVNSAFCKILGIPREFSLGKEPENFIPIATDTGYITEKMRLLRNSVEDNFDIELQRPDGQHIWANVTTKIIKNARGEFNGYLVTVADISAKRKAEKEVLISDKKYHDLFEYSIIPIFLVDAETLIPVRVNEASTQLYGYTEEELLKMPLTHLRSLETREQAYNNIRKAIDSKQTVNYAEHVTKDGRILNVKVLGKNLSYEGKDYLLINILDQTQQKQTEIELGRYVSTLRTTMEATEEAMLVFDNNWQVLNWNQRYLDMWGLTEQILKEKSLQDIVTEITKNIVNHSGENMLEVFDHDFQSTLPKKTIELNDGRTIERYTNPLIINGENVGMIMRYNDITDLKEIENALSENIAMLQSTLDAVSDYILFTSENKDIIIFNKPYERIEKEAGISFKGVKHKVLIDHQKGKFIDPKGFEKRMDEIYKDIKEPSYDLLRMKNGRVLERHSVPRYFEGKYVGRVWIVTDISARVKAEEERKGLAAIIEETSDMVSMAKDGMNIYLNKAGRELIGFKKGEEIGIPIDSFYTPRQAKLTKTKIRDAAIENGIWKGENLIVNKSGTQIPVSQVVIAHKNEKGEIEFFSTVIRDISEQKEYEKKLRAKNIELEKINAELDRIVYSASHELRTPVKSILGLVELAENEENLSPDIKEYFHLIHKSVIGLDELFKQIIHYSESSHMKLTRQLVNYEDVLPFIIETTTGAINHNNIDIQYSIDQDADFHSDLTSIKVLLTNILSNAIKHHNADKKTPWIKVHIKADKHKSVISVEDNGIGIAREHLDKIFNMFFRINNNSSGSGIGLYIVKEILQKLNGYARVESEPGKGTKFTMIVPQMDMLKPE